MHRRLVYSALFLLAYLSLAAPASGRSSQIRTIELHGNSAFSTREILQWLSSRPGAEYSTSAFENDRQVIVENYRRQGFLAARVDSVRLTYPSDSTFVDLGIWVGEGRRTIVGSISLTGVTGLSVQEILDRFEVHQGDPLDQSALEGDIEELLGRYDRHGYPFAECSISGLRGREGGDRDTLDITLAVLEHQRMTIDEIKVEGNTETDPAVVIRETRISPGEVYTPSKIEAIRQRLNRLNIFASVDEPQLYLRQNKGGLLLRVREGTTNTFDGVLGYVPGLLPGESGYVTGLASISMRNLLGTGRKLSFRWQREDTQSQELSVRYLEPWVASLPINIGIGFLQRQQDSSYVRRLFDTKAEVMMTEELSISALLGLESVIPSATAAVQRVSKSSTTSAGIEVQYDGRDDPYSPTSGVRYRTDYQYGRKNLIDVLPAALGEENRGSTVQRFGLDLEVFVPAFARQVVAVSFHGRELRSGQPEEGEMFRLGGTQTLRGYRESQFVGSRVAWTNSEYRFLLARRTFLYGFIDSGYYYRPADPERSVPQSDAFKYGYGIGVQLQTALGLVGVSFALGQGDSFSNGKVHFGLINEF
jgi:outer membrane protein assembly factor BamA